VASVADGAHVDPGARLAPDVVVQPGAVVHAEVVVGPGCVIEAGAVLGKRPRLRAGSSAAGGAELGPLVVGAGVSVCAGAVVSAGTTIGDGAIIGDQAQVRERVTIGAGSLIGRGSAVEFGTRIGERVRVQTNVYITALGVVEDDVFVGPGVCTTNDNWAGRRPAGVPLAGPVLRRACRVGGGAVLLPGVEVGEEAFVGAGAVVTRDVPARAVVIGVPARVVRHVRDEELLGASGL
jgi:acetyltransferase-like isoleucine patch superfamily enzyme